MKLTITPAHCLESFQMTVKRTVGAQRTLSWEDEFKETKVVRVCRTEYWTEVSYTEGSLQVPNRMLIKEINVKGKTS